MTRALLLLALVLSVGAGAWWVVGSGDERTADPSEASDRATVLASHRAPDAAEAAHSPPNELLRPTALTVLDKRVEPETSAAYVHDEDCVVIVRLLGPREATAGAEVRLATAYPQPEPGAEDAGLVEHGVTGNDGVVRFEVGRNALLHGLTVRHPTDWVWSSRDLPVPLEAGSRLICPVVIEHEVPAAGGSISGRALALDGRRHEQLRPFLVLRQLPTTDEILGDHWLLELPLHAEVDDDGHYEFAGLAGEFDLYTWPRELAPLWTWRGTIEPGAELRDLDLVFAPTVNLSVRVPALADEPPRSVVVVARLGAAQRDALLEGTWAADPPAPPPGVERDDRVASAELNQHGNASLTVPQHAVWVSVTRGGAPIPLRHDSERVFEVLHDPVHGPLTLLLDDAP